MRLMTVSGSRIFKASNTHGRHTIQLVNIAKDKSLRRLTPQHIELMAKDEDFQLSA